MSAGTNVKHVEVTTRGNLPQPLAVGTLYFILDESRIIVNHGDKTVEYAGTAEAVVNSLSGGQTQKAPSVSAVARALDDKADLLGGKIILSQLPPTMTLYRGIFATGAALAAAFPTDTTGAYATVTATSSTWYYDGTGWKNTGALGASAVQSVNGKAGPNAELVLSDIVNANIAAGLLGNANLSASNPVVGKNQLPAAASETTAGILPLATAAEATAGTNATDAMTPLTARAAIDTTPAGNPATIFANPGAGDMGLRNVVITNAAEGKPPLYELYGTTGTQRYIVLTYGDMSGSLIQEAAWVGAVSRKFTRQRISGAWGKWTELAASESYFNGYLTKIVDGENGDDAIANGTEAAPYQTIQAALNSIPKIIDNGAVTVMVKAGTYNITSAISLSSVRGRVTLRSYSGEKDVTVSADFSQPTAAIFNIVNCEFFQMQYIDVVSLSPENTCSCFYGFLVRYTDIRNCSFSGARNTTAYTHLGGSAIIVADGWAYTGPNSFSNCVNAIKVDIGLIGGPGNTTVADVDYGVFAIRGIACGLGSGLTGSIANTRTTSGLIIS